ncbi:MAG: type II secretion system protein [Clostridia bacterium]|nr:type II secretion system protein [Clostridia bacterium]
MKKNNKKGFTLVELVIVVAVMAILVAVAIPTIGSIRSSAQSSVDNSNAQTVESIIKLAYSEQTGDGNLSTTAVEKAISEAKLGIAAGKTFFYDVDTGDCTAGSKPSTSTNGYTIAFDTSTTSATDLYAGITVTGVGSLAPAA